VLAIALLDAALLPLPGGLDAVKNNEFANASEREEATWLMYQQTRDADKVKIHSILQLIRMFAVLLHNRRADLVVDPSAVSVCSKDELVQFILSSCTDSAKSRDKITAAVQRAFPDTDILSLGFHWKESGAVSKKRRASPETKPRKLVKPNELAVDSVLM
jgi:hypothetical protein